jgi:hypothetical protein
MAPDLERLARTPWPIACWASCHIDDPYCFDRWLRRLDPEPGRGLAARNTAPVALGNPMLAERVGMEFDLDPPRTSKRLVLHAAGKRRN